MTTIAHTHGDMSLAAKLAIPLVILALCWLIGRGFEYFAEFLLGGEANACESNGHCGCDYGDPTGKDAQGTIPR